MTALRVSSTRSGGTNFSDSPGTDVARPSAFSEAVSGVTTDGVSAGFEAPVPQSGGDEMGSKGVDSVFFRADESKDIEAAEHSGGVVDGSGGMSGAVAEATDVAMEAAPTEALPAAPGHAIEEEKACDGDEEGGGTRSTTTSGERLGRVGESACDPSHADSFSPPSLSSDNVDKIRGEGEKDTGEPEESGAVEEERAVGQAAAAVAVADGIGPNESLGSTDTVAGDPAAAAARATTPVVAPRGRAAELLRPPPIVTEDSPPILRTSSSEMTGQADSGDDTTGDAMDPEQMRRCFVAKTFSPSDLGLGEMRQAGENGGGGAVQQPVTKESLMKARKRRRTIHKGNIPGIEGRRHTVDEVLGLDDPQAVLGSVPPERLFSITGMFHPEAPVKVSLLFTGSIFCFVDRSSLSHCLSACKKLVSSRPPCAAPQG